MEEPKLIFAYSYNNEPIIMCTERKLEKSVQSA